MGSPVLSNILLLPLEDLLRAAELHDANPEEDLEVHPNGSVERVVRINRHGDCFEGVTVTRDADKVRDHEAKPSEHRNASMLQFRLAEVRHQLRILGKTDWIELVPAPRPLGTDEALRELPIVEEAD